MAAARTLALALLAGVLVLGCSSETEKRAQPPSPPSSTQAAPTTPKALATPGLAETVQRLDASLRRGTDWLLKQQQPDGTFGQPPAKVGMTALALSALLSSPDGAKLRELPAVQKAIAYVVSSQQPDGSINTAGDKGLANYQTSAALSALAALNDPAHEKIRKAAQEFLVSLQRHDDLNAGGFGYDRDKRADISNTQFTLEALKASGLDENSEAFKSCVAFLQRCQNRSESNDQPWATNDGGGIYYPGQSKAGVITLPNGKVVYKSYGSMTYALLRCYILAGLKPDDPRVVAAQKWIAAHYTVDENPEMGLQGLYYYYLTMAKALSLLGSATLELPDGTRRIWPKDLGDKLASLQHADGYWINTQDRWFEQDKVLVTSYTILALSECRAMLAKQP